MVDRIVIIGVVVFFTAIGGCKKDTSTPSTPGGGGQVITVNGYVKDLNGEPVSGKPVIITGKGSVLSASDGSFSVSNVTTPYDITLIAVIGSLRIAVIYEGLTRSDPVLAYPGGPTGTQKNATISGTVPVVANTVTRVFFTSGDFAWATTAGMGGAFSIYPSWYGPDTALQGQLHVLRHPSTPAIPTSYDAYGSRSLTITNGGLHANNNFLTGDLTDPTEQSISGSVVRPSNYTLSTRDYYIAFGGAAVLIANEPSPPDAFNFAAPNISGATFPILVQWLSSNAYSFSWKTGLTPGASGVSITLESTAQPVLPVNNAINVDTNTVFQWVQGSGTGVNRTFIYDGIGQPQYWIYTTEDNIRIPNLEAYGLSLPTNRAYSWYVERYVPVGSVNDVASDAFRRLSNYRGGDFRITSSEIFNFTTRP